MMRVVVETPVSGPDLTLNLKPNDTIVSLKNAIWKSSGIPPYHQALIFKGKELGGQSDTMTVHSVGLLPESRLKLILLTRSGPLFHKRTQPKKMEEVATTSRIGRWSSVETEDGDEDGREANNRRREDFSKRWEEERRTRAKMRKIQEDMERLRLERNRSVIRDDRGPVMMEEEPEEAPPNPNRCLLLSAPEDTSAKESSAGETEYDEWMPRAWVGRNSVGTTTSAELPERRKVETRQPRVRSAGTGPRLLSSSSEPESSGAVWTGSEEIDDCLWTADEGPLLPAPEDEEYFSGQEVPLPIPSGQDAPLPAALAEETPSPSELSSGMLMCEWANDNRRAKVQRRKAYPPKPRPVPPLPKAPPPKTSQRPRSKPRQGQIVMPVVPVSLMPSSSKDEGSSECTSSDGERGKKGKVKRQGDWATIRSHRTPHSSQSQQRCHACAQRLSLPNTFQCRCGKAFCSRHKHPDIHTCSSTEPSKTESATKPRTHLPKFQQVSD